jgi:hypothetical protein
MTLLANYVAPPPGRAKIFGDDVDRQELVERLRTATPAEIKTYVENQVTSLASAKVLLAKILLVLSTTV